MNEPICKRCLIEKIDPLGILETVRKRVELIPAEEKVSDEEYARRLEACIACKELNLGMCNLCGCFVEYRAAHTDMHCPGSGKYW